MFGVGSGVTTGAGVPGSDGVFELAGVVVGATGVVTAGDDAAGGGVVGGVVGVGMDAAFTLIVHVAFTFLLLLETAVIFALPSFFALTTPFLLTDATDFLFDFQVTFLFALAGFTFAFKVNLSPTVKVLLFLFSVIIFALGAAFAYGVVENAVRTSIKDKMSATDFLVLFAFKCSFHIFIVSV